ncbi:unnamed protein product [Pleuronectes platessa]|uniref:Uncharacterized protein n=1 Tax=Pleuronectes platessa TaxID=8262 RepID=A0A9N7Z1A8_PLEPL|nr:unnamed protein product [Pleuronectes platessa]
MEYNHTHGDAAVLDPRLKKVACQSQRPCFLEKSNCSRKGHSEQQTQPGTSLTGSSRQCYTISHHGSDSCNPFSTPFSSSLRIFITSSGSRPQLIMDHVNGLRIIATPDHGGS